jgi:hypothetical protein
MAKGTKTGGRNFAKGQSGNPKGGPGLPKDLKDARKFNQAELERAVNRLIYLDPAEVEAFLAAHEPNYLYRIVAQILDKAAQFGDQNRLEWVCTRLIGKVTDRIEVTTPRPFAIFRHGSDEPAAVLGISFEKKEGA